MDTIGKVFDDLSSGFSFSSGEGPTSAPAELEYELLLSIIQGNCISFLIHIIVPECLAVILPGQRKLERPNVGCIQARQTLFEGKVERVKCIAWVSRDVRLAVPKALQ